MNGEFSIANPDSVAPEPGVTLKWTANQLHAAMDEADCSIEELMGAMTGLFAQITGIRDEANCDVKAAEPEKVLEVIRERCSDAEDLLRVCTVALQFYDRLSQRIEHAQRSLNFVADDMVPTNSASITDWHVLFSRLDSMYSEDQKQRINLHLSSRDMPRVAAQASKILSPARDTDIELF